MVYKNVYTEVTKKTQCFILKKKKDTMFTLNIFSYSLRSGVGSQVSFLKCPCLLLYDHFIHKEKKKTQQHALPGLYGLQAYLIVEKGSSKKMGWVRGLMTREYMVLL